MVITMKQKIKILYVAAEIAPYVNAGGLGEVGRSFPKALAQMPDIEVRRVMPLHREIGSRMKYVTDFPVPMESGMESCVVKKDLDKKEIGTYFIGNDKYFCRDHIYGYDDDGFRYFFFCCAVCEMLKHITFKPDIVQMNDWHTGFLPLFLRREFPEIKTVYTIHNISYHGFIPPSFLQDRLSLQELEDLGWPDWLNFMKAGILYSDQLTTVSPGYGKEIRKPEFGFGMSQIIEKRKNDFVGILNGIDTNSYNPSQDGVLTYPYCIQKIEQKKYNRKELRLTYGLKDIDVPLAAMVTRLDYSKGIELILGALEKLDIRTFQLIILGSGSHSYQEKISAIASQYPNSIAADFNYNATIAKKIYAAADIYLMPSLFEPCGLGQLYAMRYGTVPVVNPVGGLRDTVRDESIKKRRPSGFYMEEWSSEGLVLAFERAIGAYHTDQWKQYVINCMKFDSSWKRSVTEYAKLYWNLMNGRNLQPSI
jgi:starch synthase